MPDTSPLTESKLKILEAYPIHEISTEEKVCSFEKIKQNFKASFECHDSIKRALKDAQYWLEYKHPLRKIKD